MTVLGLTTSEARRGAKAVQTPYNNQGLSFEDSPCCIGKLPLKIYNSLRS